MYELVVIWNTGEKESYLYKTRDEAVKAASGYKIAFGSQVWTAVNTAKFETFKEAVRQADARRDYEELKRLEAVNPSMYEEAYGQLSLESLDDYYEAQAELDELYPARPVEA